MSTDDVSKTLGPRGLQFLEEQLDAQRADELPALFPKGPQLPDGLRLMHEHRALSVRLRQTAQAIGSPLSREEADSEAERMLSDAEGLPIAAFRKALARFAPKADSTEDPS